MINNACKNNHGQIDALGDAGYYVVCTTNLINVHLIIELMQTVDDVTGVNKPYSAYGFEICYQRLNCISMAINAKFYYNLILKLFDRKFIYHPEEKYRHTQYTMGTV